MGTASLGVWVEYPLFHPEAAAVSFPHPRPL